MKRCGCGRDFAARGNARRCPTCRGIEETSAPAAGVLAATKTQLRMIGKEADPLGETALVLAARLDAGADPGSAMAAMAKELRTLLAELMAAAPAIVDPVDELRKRRERRLSG